MSTYSFDDFFGCWFHNRYCGISREDWFKMCQIVIKNNNMVDRGNVFEKYHLSVVKV